MKEVEIEVGDECYTLTVEHYQHPVASSHDDPGDGGEIELGDTVTVYGDGTNFQISFNMFIEIYGGMHGVTDSRARQLVEQKAMELVADSYEADYEDSSMRDDD